MKDNNVTIQPVSWLLRYPRAILVTARLACLLLFAGKAFR